jgi:hypothetical protein
MDQSIYNENLLGDNLEELNKELLECSRYGESNDLLDILKSGGNSNYCDESGTTALHKAGNNHVHLFEFNN